jgi:hypothetical protein
LSPRARPTFSKRQKEQARQAKQQAKSERKQQRKLEKLSGVTAPDTEEIGLDLENASESEPFSPQGNAAPDAAITHKEV